MLTRFVPSIATPRDAVGGDPGKLDDVRCVVRLRGPGGFRELIIGTDTEGGIIVTAQRDALGQRARGQLAFHEVASAGRVLELDADELYVFDLQTMEMLPDAPGPNDALYVYGLLYGPYPAVVDTAIVAVEGQLTVTRADLLGALVDGVAAAFAYPPDAQGSRAIHAVLPGERADVIASGRGIILALPLAPTWLPECPLSNDLVAAQLLYDVLGALRADLGITEPLPVPNRAALEAELAAKGWRIEGDEAVRPKATGLLGALRGSDRKRLPRQGTLDELVTETRAVLTKVAGVPTPEAQAIRARMMRTQPVIVKTPTPTPVVQTPAPPRAEPRPRVVGDRTEWMKDFVDAHRSPSRPAPQVTTPARAVSTAATPEWMNDFAEPAPSEAPDAGDDDAPKPKPDWSRDFE